MSKLDAPYFEKKLKLVLRDIGLYTSEELALELYRLATTANCTIQSAPLEFQKLQRENAELTRKLAEHQALLSQLDTAMPNFAQMFNVLEQDWVRDNCWTTWDEETITEFRRLHKAVCNPDTEELTKLLAEAKSKAVPEGWQLVPKKPTAEMLEAGRRRFYHTPCGHWEAMLAAAPQPGGSNE